MSIPSTRPLWEWDQADWNAVLPYVGLRSNTCVPMTAIAPGIEESAVEHASYFASRDLSSVRRGVLAGNPEDTLDMALRAASGVSVPRDPAVAISHLLKITSDPRTPRAFRGRAFSVLSSIHFELRVDASDPSTWNIDSVYRAAVNADAAAALGFVSPNVLWVARNIDRVGFRRQSECKFPGHSTARFEALTDLWRVYDRRGEQLKREQECREGKVSKAPNAYVCAAPGCGIEATHKSALQQCSGKCSKEGKPAYCSKECQRQDWKRHKPFCKEGAPVDCVVAQQRQDIASGASAAPSRVSSNGMEFVAGVIGAPTESTDRKEHLIDLPDPTRPGQFIKMSSRTQSPAAMKELRDQVYQAVSERQLR